MANLSAEEPDALMRARPGLWEPWRVTARATQSDANGDARCQEHTINVNSRITVVVALKILDAASLDLRTCFENQFSDLASRRDISPIMVM
jgi:hypothetical protein